MPRIRYGAPAFGHRTLVTPNHEKTSHHHILDLSMSDVIVRQRALYTAIGVIIKCDIYTVSQKRPTFGLL